MKEGTDLKGYAIRQRLGKGGMGEVWAATAPDGQEVVVKCLPSEVSTPEETLALRSRLRREAQILVGLRHEGIVKALDWFEADGEIHLVLEHIHGPTLAEWLDSHPPLAQRLDLLRQVTTAVAYAHGEQVIHRDLKPSNILVAPGPRAKVLDFGLARAVDSTRLTQTGVTLGTIAYMAPEQARALAVDARADVFSLGMILAQALDLAEPFRHAGDSARIYRSLISSTPIVVDGWLPEEVRSVLGLLVEKDRNRRGTIDDLRALLERLQSEDHLEGRLTAAREAFETSGTPPALPPIDRPELGSALDQLGARRASQRGGAILVLGPPGSGKTWLLTDAAERLRAAGVRTFESVFIDAAAPFRIPWEYVLEREREDSKGRSSTGETLTLPRNPAAAAALIQRFLDDVRRDASAGGVALLLDDVHLAPEEDHGWIERLLEGSRDCPLALVLSGDSAREGAGEARAQIYGTFLSRVAASAEFATLTLASLPEVPTLGGLDLHGVPAADARAMYAIAGGNPELINLLLAHRHAGGKLSDISGLKAPHVLERLRARYQLVDPVCRGTVRVLLDAGGETSVAAVASAVERSELTLHGHLQDLERKHGWVKRAGTTVRITHPLLGRVATG